MSDQSVQVGPTQADPEGFRGPAVCAIVGITYRQLDYWARTGLVTPSVAPARGSGTQRLYSFSDLLALKVIKNLLDSGLSLQAARRAVGFLRSCGEDLSAATLVLSGKRSVLARSGEELIDLLRGGQTALNVVPVGGLMGELQAAVVAFRGPRPLEAPDALGSQAAGGTSGGA